MGKILGRYIMPHPPIMVPEIGKGEDEKVKNTKESCSKIAKEIKEKSPDVIVIITPHGPLFRDAISISNFQAISGNFKDFGSGDIRFNYKVNKELVNDILQKANTFGVPVVPIDESSKELYDISGELDHGAMVPLYFINKEFKGYKIVNITYGLLSEINLYKFGVVIKEAIENSDFNAVIIGSGDLSHRLSNDGPYTYNSAGEIFDKEFLRLLETGDIKGLFSIDKNIIVNAGECGLRSTYILLGTTDENNFKGEILSYEGPFGVGYGVIKLNLDKKSQSFVEILKDINNKKVELRKKNEDIYVRLARESLEHYIKFGTYINNPKFINEDMKTQKRGAFVSLKSNGELRGCIGTIFPFYENLAEEIINNAVQAGVEDPRFYPIDESELIDIEYSVDILMDPVKATLAELDPKNYGVIVRCGGRTGLLLPDLEGVDTVDEQINIALKKAGISESENYSIEKFQVIRHK